MVSCGDVDPAVPWCVAAFVAEMLLAAAAVVGGGADNVKPLLDDDGCAVTGDAVDEAVPVVEITATYESFTKMQLHWLHFENNCERQQWLKQGRPLPEVVYDA